MGLLCKFESLIKQGIVLKVIFLYFDLKFNNILRENARYLVKYLKYVQWNNIERFLDKVKQLTRVVPSNTLLILRVSLEYSVERLVHD